MENLFGARVRQARKLAGLTQSDLAEKVNLDETTISRIENGVQFTSFQSMLRFSDVLNVHLDYLICDYLSSDKDQHNPVMLEISEMLTPLPDHYKVFVRDMIKNMIETFPPDSEEKED